MTDYLRVKDPGTGHEFTVPAHYIDAGLTDEADVIDKAALGPDGLPAPAKPSLPLGTPLPGSATDRRRSRNSAPTPLDKSNDDGQSAENTEK